MSFPFLNDLTRRSPLRTTQQIRPASGPGNDGETLFAFLYSLKEDHPDSFEVIMDTLRAAFPSLESIKLPSVGAGIVSLTWKDRNFSQPFYMNELSEGTLRFLWLVCILANPTPATVTIIDEPEVSLHPEMLALLVPLMREASKRTQLFVATHSDRLVRHLQPEELIVFDLNEEGEAELKRGNDATLNIDEWMKDFTLDELWSMGQIGGR